MARWTASGKKMSIGTDPWGYMIIKAAGHLFALK